MLADAWPWLALILLGAWHGLNPGMGWLFAVALGLQHRSRRAVFGALAPIALGHALAIGMVVLLVYAIGAVIPFRWLQFGGAATLVYCRVLEALARATSYLGRYVRRFLGSDPLVLAHGECAWSRPHGRAGPSRSEIDFLRNSSIQRKLAALLSTRGRHRRGRHSYDLSFSCFWTSGLDRIRLHRLGGTAPFMDQP